MSGPPSSRAPKSVIAGGETWPTKSWSSQRVTARAAATAASWSTSPGAVTIAAQAAVGAQVAGERPGVDAGDGRDAVVAQQRRELAGVLEDGGRRVGDDQGPEPRPERLVVGGEPAVVADERIGHDDDLAGVRRVGADLLVAGLARVDDEVAAGRHRGPERDAREDRPVLQRQQRRPEVADPRIDDRRSPAGAAGRSRDGDPDRNDPPAAIGVVGVGVRGHRCLLRRPHGTGTPASQDRP